MIWTLCCYRLHNSLSRFYLFSVWCSKDMLSINSGAWDRQIDGVWQYIFWFIQLHVSSVSAFISALHSLHSVIMCERVLVCVCLYVCLIALLQECTTRMCWTPAGLWHFLSVYLTAYPPQDYREKKRKEWWQEHPFPLTPSFLFFFTIHTQWNLNKKCNSLANV